MNSYTENNKKYKNRNSTLFIVLIVMGSVGGSSTLLQAAGELVGVTPGYTDSADDNNNNTVSESTESIPIRLAKKRAAAARRQGSKSSITNVNIATMDLQQYRNYLMREATALKGRWGTLSQSKRIEAAQAFATRTRPAIASRQSAISDSDKNQEARKMAEWINVSSNIRREARGSWMPQE
ncbi:MAG: hypothetical protein NT124_01805 [Candidatus Dependentiae bacterium]|nr:hypothetical protein [Candidatus Dependentiae bacterium]